jgi:hypothetical protein
LISDAHGELLNDALPELRSLDAGCRARDLLPQSVSPLDVNVWVGQKIVVPRGMARFARGGGDEDDVIASDDVAEWPRPFQSSLAPDCREQEDWATTQARAVLTESEI